jgi:alkylation response protein AidB-like acyl-CoA dehydrogenase
MDAIAAGRHALERAQQARPRNWFADNPLLQALVRRHAVPATLPATTERLDRVGLALAATEDLVHRCSHEPGLPVLERWDGLGRRVERVRFDGAYHELGRLLYGSGAMGMVRKPESVGELAALVTLASHHGESGHMCPWACTAGLIKVLDRAGHAALRAALLPALENPNYDERLHASQFLTEVQGGSDVGANATRAVPVMPETAEAPAVWAIHGEKWFCSVVDAPLYLMTARPEGAPQGTRGLGLFLVPHDLPNDGGRDVHVPPLPQRWGHGPTRATNHFTVRRLKHKLGTRAMASGEVDWHGALAWQVGAIDAGFQNVVEVVLNTSRLLNALACSGMMWRAYHEAAAFAQHRMAFGRPIARFPVVDRQLAQLWVEAAAATASTFDLLALEASGAHPQALRLGLNANKYWTSVRNTQMVRVAMEVLGGNGTIEDFSPLPRLYRDAMVTESWEGTHHVLAAQTLRDLCKLRLHEAWAEWLLPRAQAAGPFAGELCRRIQRLIERGTSLRTRADDTAAADTGAWLEDAMVVHQAVCLRELGDAVPAAAVAHWLALHRERTEASEPGWWPGR